MIQLSQPLVWILAVLALTAAILDIATRRVPNAVTVSGAIAGIAIHTAEEGVRGTGIAFAGLAVGLLVFLPLFLLQGMGGGDVKLMAAIGAIVGAQNCVIIFVLTALLGGLLAVGLLVYKGGLLTAIRNTVTILGQLVRGRKPALTLA